jgi:hypothetical protein
MNNPKKLAIFGTQGTGRRQTKQGAIKNEQSIETGNIWYTRHTTKTIPSETYVKLLYFIFANL